MKIQDALKASALLLALAALVAQPPTARAQGTEFTYQGRLSDNGVPANGFFDLTFSLWSSASGPAQRGTTQTNTLVGVSNGLFTTVLDFGPGVFDGNNRWLEIGVRTNGVGLFNTLTPRQKLTPTPYAITSGNLTGALPNASLPSGGNWALSSLLTVDGGTVAIDPVSDWVGFGTSTPTAPLTVKPASSFYGIEHTDGTRRLSTYIDSGGCWFGTVSPDKLFFYVNNGLPSMTVDLFGRLGVGTTVPAWPLDILSAQSVARLVSYDNTFGSVLELRNNTASPTYLGAINFQNAAETYPGQIGYLATDALTFRTANAERMRLANNGQLDVYGSVRITGDSSHSNPFLQIKETEDGDYARIQLQVANRPLWHIGVGGANNSMVFYNSTNSIVTSISENGVLTTKVLTITGGADIAEPFQMSQRDLPKGSVVVIDEENPGHLRLSAEAYDKRVAGIISGAGGVNPGLSLSQQGVMEGGQRVALSGRVYVQADASNGPIKPGDLLTTSRTSGHAMKATDRERTPGAVIGKAMTALTEGTGLVLVLVTLQ